MRVRPLRAALVTPLSGPLARYGRPGAGALALWARSSAPPQGVELELFDAHPSPAAAMRAAVLGGPDLVFGPYGSGSALAAARVTSRTVWNHGGATDRLRRPRFPHVVNVPAAARGYFAGVLRAVREADAHATRVSLLHASTGFAREVAGGATSAAATLGFVVDELEFAPGRAAVAAAALPAGDVLLVVGRFDDELAAARGLLGRTWRAAAFVGAGVDEVLAPLGAEREGLLGPCQWLPRVALEPEEGPDATWFVHAFRERGGGEPPYPAAAAFAAGVLCARCLGDAGGAADDALVAAALRLTTRTLFGEFRLDPASALQTGHTVLVVQWQRGARRVVWPPERAESELVVPLRAGYG